jgi:ubiquinone/menaquinone biosynthesis C-methylase UbiE
MSDSQPSEQTAKYFIDAENVAEMARLTKQARVLTAQFGLAPPAIKLAKMQSALDIACGPGEWVFEVARQFPACQVTGVDISETMISYAGFSAREKEIPNAHFRVMDALQPLNFPDASFDLIYARLIFPFMTPDAYARLLGECWRILRPGGVLCYVDMDNIGITTSPSFARYNHLLMQVMRSHGQCFSAEGDYAGITAVQPRLLAQAGFQEIQHDAHGLNFSYGTAEHPIMCDDFQTALKLLQPFLVFSAAATQEELDLLYERTMEEMRRDDFSGTLFLQRVWGKKI